MANSYLTRTFGTPTNAYKFTISFWVKRSKLSVSHIASITAGTYNSTNMGQFLFNSDDILLCQTYNSGGSVTMAQDTNMKFRDTNAWYHIVLAVDGTLGTAGDRQKLYVNGELITSLATDTNASQNTNLAFNQNGIQCMIGNRAGTSYYFDGYMSHVAFVDGQQLTPTTFGETDSTSGIWKFKSPSGITWGNNGFHLKFENSAALGTDSSGEGNDFTVNGDLKQSLDTPSNVHATFNPLFVKQAPSTTNFGNTRIDQSSSAWKSSLTTIGASSGKYYAEFKAGTISGTKYNQIGVVHEDIVSSGTFQYVGDSTSGWGLNWSGSVNHNGGNVSGYTSFATGDIIGVAMDLDNHKVYWRKNNDAWMNSGDPTSGSTGTGAQSLTTGKIYFFAASVYGNECFANFGNGFFGTTAITSAGSNGNGSLFEYDVPNGYYALNTKNINTYG